MRDLTLEEKELLRDLFTRLRSELRFDERLARLDHDIGVSLGCDPYVLYQDALFAHRGYLIMADGTINLNAAEGVLAELGETDLNLAERVLSEWRDRGLR